jgi:hypothetical protein
VRKLYSIVLGFWLCGLMAGESHADTFQLTDGQTVAGEVVSYNAEGVILRGTDDKYSERVAWTKFSQEDLKKFSQNPKVAPLVEPFIEITQEDKIKKTEVPTQPPPRLQRPEQKSLVAAMFSNGVGLFVILLLYAGNIFIAYEVAVFRARPPALVCGLAAIPLLGIASPIVFLSLPTRFEPAEEQEAQQPASLLEPQSFSVPNTPAAEPEPAPDAGGLKLTHGAAASSAVPATQVFQRGAFMFNRRFFETKFSPFFGMVRRDADKDMVLLIKTGKGELNVDRISRISANEVHVQVRHGEATEETMIPFSEIKEIQLKHKNG